MGSALPASFVPPPMPPPPPSPTFVPTPGTTEPFISPTKDAYGRTSGCILGKYILICVNSMGVLGTTGPISGILGGGGIGGG